MNPNPNPNPLSNRQLPHDEVIRRFLQRIKDESQPKREPVRHELPAYQPPTPEPERSWRRPIEQLVSPKAAEELERWFRK